MSDGNNPNSSQEKGVDKTPSKTAGREGGGVAAVPDRKKQL